jgi:Superinfection immunity protein
MNFLKKSNGITLSGHALKKFSLSSSVLTLATLTSLVTFAATPAHADYYDAKLHFESLSADDRFKSILGLESTGDFNGLISLGYTERLYRAILAFEKKNNLEVDGKLQSWEINRLDSEGHILFNEVGFTDYKNSKVGSTLWVPRKLFDSEVAIDNGISFQREDRGYSLSFVAHTNDQSTFENLFEVIRTPSDIRTIDYQKIRDNFFVVTGSNKGRNFYTYMERIPTGTTGFTLSYKVENSILAGKLSTVLANSFLATPQTETPAVEPQQPQAVAATQDETIVETPLTAPTANEPVAPIAVAPVVAIAPTVTPPQPQAIPVVQVATVPISQQPISVQTQQPSATPIVAVAPIIVVQQPIAVQSQQQATPIATVLTATAQPEIKPATVVTPIQKVPLETKQVSQDDNQSAFPSIFPKIVSNASAAASQSDSDTASTIGQTIVGLLGFWTITIFLMYWLPTFVAISRKNRSRTAIIILNFFLGWTGIGWIALLVWAFSNPPQVQGVTYIDINSLAGARKI